MKDLLAILLTALFAAIGGYLLGSNGAGSTASTNPRSVEVLSKESLLGGDLPTRAATADQLRRARDAGWQQGMVEEEAEYTPEEMERDLRLLGRDPDPVARLQGLARLMENLSPETLPQVLQAFRSIPATTEYLNEYQMLLHAWTKFDRAGAIKFAEAMGTGRGQGGDGLTREELYKPVLASWAAENPRQALAWYEYLPKEDQTHHLKMSLMAGWAANDPKDAAAYLQTQPVDQNREYLAGQLASYMFKQGPAEAAAWAEGISDPKLKEQIFEELAEDWVSVDASGLASWLSKHSGASYAWEAVEDLGRGWVASDPDAATAWFEGLPEGPARQRGIDKMIESWAENDLLSMGEWLNELPDSPATDQGVRAYAERLLDLSPGPAMDSAMAIRNDQLRDETVHRMAQEWYSRNPGEALSWAQQNSYPQEALQRTVETYAELNQQQLNDIAKQINRDQVNPDRMRQLRAEQAALQEQAEQLRAMLPADGERSF